MKRILKITIFYLCIPFVFLLVVSLLPYAVCPFYDFPEEKPFSGDSWYNPYANLEGTWFKANFHAHSRAWLGVSDGVDEPSHLYARYREMGYDVVGLSNYQHIQADTEGVDFFPVYEHGYNVRKRHYLPIGAQRVIWRDYIFWQTIHHKQHMVHILKRHAPFLAIAHPLLAGGFVEEDFRRLTGYDAVEVLNHQKNSRELWDAALSAGRLAWIIGDDDTHDVSNAGQTGVCWTMVNAPSTREHHILSALESGHMYGVQGRGGFNDNSLERSELRNDSLLVKLEKPAAEISFISDGGRLLFAFPDTDSARVPLRPRDTYVRVEIRNEKSRMYLNPVVRYDGLSVPRYSATVNLGKTWLQRIVIVVFFSFIAGAYVGVRLMRRRKD